VFRFYLKGLKECSARDRSQKESADGTLGKTGSEASGRNVRWNVPVLVSESGLDISRRFVV